MPAVARYGPDLNCTPNPWGATAPRSRGDLSWRAEAACRGLGPALFHPPPGTTTAAATAEAKAVCAACPVRADCLDHALAHDETGIWGGTTQRDRITIRRGATGPWPCEHCDGSYRSLQALRSHAGKAHPDVAAACGTLGGYQRHRRLDEDPCDACRAARNTYQRDHRAQRRSGAA